MMVEPIWKNAVDAVAKRMRVAPLAIIMALPFLADAEQASAQARIRAQVVDSTTGMPISAARIRLRFTRFFAVSNNDGNFEIPASEGSILDIDRIGYDSTSVTVPAGLKDRLVIKMGADAILLNAIEVSGNRILDRRKAYPRRVKVLEGVNLRKLLNDNLLDAISEHLVPLVPCSSNTAERSCVSVNMNPTQVRLFVDETPYGSSLRELMDMPVEMIYSVEAYDNGRQIRVYTRKFIEYAARTGYIFPPVPIQ